MKWQTMRGRLFWAREYCAARGLSGRAIAEKAQLSKSYLSKTLTTMEEHGEIGLGVGARLARVMEVDIWWLATGEGWPSEQVRRDHETPGDTESPSAERVQRGHVSAHNDVEQKPHRKLGAANR